MKEAESFFIDLHKIPVEFFRCIKFQS